jgi:hypothetical protein
MSNTEKTANRDLTVQELIDALAKVKDKSKWVYLTGAGCLTAVDECCDDEGGEDQSTVICLMTKRTAAQS